MRFTKLRRLVPLLLKKYRPDLTLHNIGTPPTGLALVRNLDPGSRYLLDHYDRLYEEFIALDFSYLDEDQAEKLSLFPNDWGKISALLMQGRTASTAAGRQSGSSSTTLMPVAVEHNQGYGRHPPRRSGRDRGTAWHTSRRPCPT